MRIISQDGCTDIPYERYTIGTSMGKVIAYETLMSDAYIELGEYSSRDKALKVMGKIRNAYEACNYDNTQYGIAPNIGYVCNGLFQMPKNEEVAE